MELQDIYTAIVEGEDDDAEELVQEAIDDGVAPGEIINKYMIPAMDEVGRLFEEEEYFVPELLMSANAMKAALSIVQPLLKQSGGEPVGYVVIGTVKGDLHDIGKNLVASLMEGGGFEVNDLGVDVAPERFVEEAKKHDKTVVCLSALLTTTMPQMKATIEALKEAGLREKTIVMVGGAPVTQQFADEIGADAYTLNASSAVQKAKELVAK